MAELPTLGIVAGKNQRVENRFSSTRLGGFVVVSPVAVVGPDVLPKPDAFGDVFDQPAFINRRTRLCECDPQGRSGQGVRQRCVTRYAERPVIAGGSSPLR